MNTTYRSLWLRLAPSLGEGEAKAVVRMLLEEAFALSFSDICCGAVEQLPPADLARLEQFMRRLEQAEPIQYVLGEAEFGGRRYCVSPSVLIPRPETWQLCEQASDFLHTLLLKNADQNPAVLDIGTGSGCIAVSLALACPEATVEAWDIAADALAVARKNAERLDARVNFCQQDALTPPDDHRRWDLVVSNPPYICDSERTEMEAHVVCHEPHLALFVPDADPLRFYRSIGLYARKALREGGALMLETNTRYAEATAQLLLEQGFSAVSVENDLFSRPRFVLARVL